MKGVFIMCSALMASLLISCSRNEDRQQKAKMVRTTTVTGASPQNTIQYPGKVKAADDASLSFKVAGRIQEYKAKEGEFVHKGDILVVMDPSDYELQLNAIEAEYAQVKGDCERVMALYADSATTKSNYDRAVSGLKQITAKLNNARNQVGYTKITAPYDGYIQKHMMDENEIVAAGMPVISMMSSKSMIVEINLPASEYVKRERFKSFSCTFDVYPGKIYTLNLINITPKANANQLYPVRLQLVEVADQPIPSVGMNTMVSIISQEEESNEMSVPTSAVCNSNGETYVYVVENDKASKRNVSIMKLKSNGMCEIVSNEVKEGDVIISSGIHHVDNGDTVKTMSEPSAANVGKLL
ncbi:MAG: efflux RND transporter periplasmic adaptor subunit [Bacteroidia bacterium]|nr:efflux RND transporter periplasmic adaptor subunit [Bacteroidia bacterium]